MPEPPLEVGACFGGAALHILVLLKHPSNTIADPMQGVLFARNHRNSIEPGSLTKTTTTMMMSGNEARRTTKNLAPEIGTMLQSSSTERFASETTLTTKPEKNAENMKSTTTTRPVYYPDRPTTTTPHKHETISQPSPTEDSLAETTSATTIEEDAVSVTTPQPSPRAVSLKETKTTSDFSLELSSVSSKRPPLYYHDAIAVTSTTTSNSETSYSEHFSITSSETTGVTSHSKAYDVTYSEQESITQQEDPTASTSSETRTPFLSPLTKSNFSTDYSPTHVQEELSLSKPPAVKENIVSNSTTSTPTSAKTPVSQITSLVSARSLTTTRITTTETWWKPARYNEGSKTDGDDVMQYFLLFAFIAPLALFVIAVLIYGYYNVRKVYKAKVRARARQRRRNRQKTEPREVRSEKLDMSLFKDKGPLVMQSSFSGDVKHALQDMRSVSLHTLVFDTAQNSLVKIGTEVEQMIGGTEETQKSKTNSLITCKSTTELTKTKTPIGSGESIPDERLQWMATFGDLDLATCVTASISEKGKATGGSSEYSSAEKILPLTSTEKMKSSKPHPSSIATSGSAEKTASPTTKQHI